VRSIVQTRDGYLWMTTFDGLARFDGVRFTVFDKSNTPALSNNRLTALQKTTMERCGLARIKARSCRTATESSTLHLGRGASWRFHSGLQARFNDELMIVSAKGAFFTRENKFVPVPPEYTDKKLKLYRGPSGTSWTI